MYHSKTPVEKKKNTRAFQRFMEMCFIKQTKRKNPKSKPSREFYQWLHQMTVLFLQENIYLFEHERHSETAKDVKFAVSFLRFIQHLGLHHTQESWTQFRSRVNKAGTGLLQLQPASSQEIHYHAAGSRRPFFHSGIPIEQANVHCFNLQLNLSFNFISHKPFEIT